MKIKKKVKGMFLYCKEHSDKYTYSNDSTCEWCDKPLEEILTELEIEVDAPMPEPHSLVKVNNIDGTEYVGFVCDSNSDVFLYLTDFKMEDFKTVDNKTWTMRLYKRNIKSFKYIEEVK